MEMDNSRSNNMLASTVSGLGRIYVCMYGHTYKREYNGSTERLPMLLVVS